MAVRRRGPMGPCFLLVCFAYTLFVGSSATPLHSHSHGPIEARLPASKNPNPVDMDAMVAQLHATADNAPLSSQARQEAIWMIEYLGRQYQAGIRKPTNLVVYTGQAEGEDAKKTARFAQDNRDQKLEVGTDSAQTLINDAVEAKVKVTPKFTSIILGIVNAFLNFIGSDKMFVFSSEKGAIKKLVPARASVTAETKHLMSSSWGMGNPSEVNLAYMQMEDAHIGRAKHVVSAINAKTGEERYQIPEGGEEIGKTGRFEMIDGREYDSKTGLYYRQLPNGKWTSEGTPQHYPKDIPTNWSGRSSPFVEGKKPAGGGRQPTDAHGPNMGAHAPDSHAPAPNDTPKGPGHVSSPGSHKPPTIPKPPPHVPRV